MGGTVKVYSDWQAIQNETQKTQAEIEKLKAEKEALEAEAAESRAQVAAAEAQKALTEEEIETKQKEDLLKRLKNSKKLLTYCDMSYFERTEIEKTLNSAINELQLANNITGAQILFEKVRYRLMPCEPVFAPPPPMQVIPSLEHEISNKENKIEELGKPELYLTSVNISLIAIPLSISAVFAVLWHRSRRSTTHR